MIGIFQRHADDENMHEFLRDTKLWHATMPSIARRLVQFIGEEAMRQSPAEADPLCWHLSGLELLKRSLTIEEQAQIGKYKFIVDVQNALGNPKRKWTQLFEVLDIWGYSHFGWTPMMWKMHKVFQDDCVACRDQNRWPFTPGKDVVHEFLYLLCDHKGGRRDFGPNGKFNGTLLWPEALAFFIKQIGDA